MGIKRRKAGHIILFRDCVMSIFIVNFLRIHPESESSRRWERRINKIGCSVPTNKSRKIPALNLVLDGDQNSSFSASLSIDWRMNEAVTEHVRDDQTRLCQLPVIGKRKLDQIVRAGHFPPRL